MPRKSVTIHYRKLENSELLHEMTLDHAVRLAMGKTDTSGIKLADNYRLRILTQGDNNYLINSFNEGEDYAFGDIVHFTPGHLQALIAAENEQVPAAKVEQMPAPSKREYIHSLMYWMVRGDHVFLIQSQSLKAETVENYFTWLLGEKGGVLQSNNQIILSSRLDSASVGGDLEDITEVVVGGVWGRPTEKAPHRSSTPKKSKTHKELSETHEEKSISKNLFSNWERLPGILEAFIAPADLKSIMDSIPQDAQLKVDVHIGYKTKKRKVDRRALRELEVGLRNMPDSQLTVVGKGGKRAADGTIMLNHKARVKLYEIQGENGCRPGSLLDPTDVLRAMNEAYMTFRDNGKIDA